jgi:hypothetical protein
MSCLLCASGNQAEFGGEILIHFRGLKNLDKPPFWVFPKLLVCLDCGSSRFMTPESELALLARGAPAREGSINPRPCRIAA